MSYHSRRAAEKAARASEARANARVEAIVRIGPRPHGYDGGTPPVMDGAPVLATRGIGWAMRSRETRGTAIRAGRKGGLRLQRPNLAADAPKGGGARLAAGEWLAQDETGALRVASTARVEPPAVAETNTPAARDAMRNMRVPATVLRGDDDAPVRDTDPGDDDATIATRAYYARLRRERGDWRPEDFDDTGTPTTLEDA